MKIYDDLHNFYVTAKSSSISSAAKKLEIEQGSLSISLTRLENNLNQKLLLRKRTGIELTQEGGILYRHISQNYSNINGIISEILNKDIEEKFEEISILTTTGVLSTLIINVIEKFNEDFPNISINLKTFEGPVNFSDMNVDVGILPTVIDIESVNKTKVTTLKSQIFCSKKYIEKYGEPKSISELKNHKFIGYYNSLKGYKGNVDWHLKYSSNGEADFKINLASSQLYAAEKGLGLLAIPREIPMSENMKMLFPDQNSLIDVFAITQRDQKNSKVDRFVEYVREYI